MSGARWLQEFPESAAKADRFANKDDYGALLAASLIGEAGSAVAELKKVERYRNQRTKLAARLFSLTYAPDAASDEPIEHGARTSRGTI